MKTVIVIPTYNETENIAQLIKQIFSLNIAHLNILVVDDNSPDQTAQLVKTLQANFPKRLHLITRPGKLGLGSAYIVGFNWALRQKADLIFEMDADGSHDYSDIPKLIQPLVENTADVTIGSRKIKYGKIIGWNIFRHLASWGAMAITRLILGLKTKDVTAGFRGYRRQVLTKLNLNKIKTNGYAFQEEMIWLCEKKNFRIKEIPVTFKDRQRGQSKLNYKDIIEFFITLVRLKNSSNN
jgi:dolichol-phosphate mannosyltransferase